jgi:hypothetical protein
MFTPNQRITSLTTRIEALSDDVLDISIGVSPKHYQ